MSKLRQLGLVTRREFVQRVRSRAFQVSNLLILGLLAAGLAIPALFGDDDEPTAVGMVGEVPNGFEAALRANAAVMDLEVVLRPLPSTEAAEDALRRGDVAVVLDDRELVWHEESAPSTAAAVAGAVFALERSDAIDELGITAAAAEELITPRPLASRTLVEPDPEKGPRRAVALIGLLVLYSAILLYGSFLMMSVIEEKSSRVVEVLTSRVEPHVLLAGKVAGMGLLGLAQMAILAAGAMVALVVLPGPDMPDLTGFGAGMIGWVVLWFLLGYAVLSVIYAALGATVSNQEDAQGVAWMPAVLVVPALLIGQIAVESPDAAIVKIASIFPFTSPMVMPMRIADGSVPLWEVTLAIALVVATIYGVLRIAGRVYSGALIQLGPRVRLREAWRAARG